MTVRVTVMVTLKWTSVVHVTTTHLMTVFRIVQASGVVQHGRVIVVV